MVEQHRFDPDWVIAPSACLAEVLDIRGLTAPLLAGLIAHTGGPPTTEALPAIRAVLNREPMPGWMPAALEAALGKPSAGFWRRFEDIYRDGLARGLADTTPLEDPGAD